MRGLPPLDPEEASAPNPNTQAVDASASPIHDAWNKWTSSPANNAALLQFGIAMLQPHGTGQSQIGAAANAIGEAGQAEGRYTQAQGEEESRQAQIEDKESQAKARTVAGEAAMINARAYAEGVRNRPLGAKGPSAEMAIQKQFNSWLGKPEDTTGLQVDPIVGALAKKYPNIKTKADLLANRPAMQDAYRMFRQNMADPTEVDNSPAGVGTPQSDALPPPPAQAAPPQTTQFRNKKTGAMEDFTLINGQWVKQ